MKDYIVSVLTAAIICGAIRSLINEKMAAGKLIKLLTGLFMTITVVMPILNISFDSITNYFDGLSIQANSYVTHGETATQTGIAGIIKSKTEAYILDKANRMGLEIAVEVELDETNNSIPCGVTITGALSPYAKGMLGGFMEDTLGIPKEKQKWM